MLASSSPACLPPCRQHRPAHHQEGRQVHQGSRVHARERLQGESRRAMRRGARTARLSCCSPHHPSPTGVHGLHVALPVGARHLQVQRRRADDRAEEGEARRGGRAARVRAEGARRKARRARRRRRQGRAAQGAVHSVARQEGRARALAEDDVGAPRASSQADGWPRRRGRALEGRRRAARARHGQPSRQHARLVVVHRLPRRLHCELPDGPHRVVGGRR